MKKAIRIGFFSFVLSITACCKHKTDNDVICNPTSLNISPFIERYGNFTCGGNLYEYEYIKRKQSQIDSLFDCTFSPPVAFPVDETNMLYIMYGKMSYYRYDTFQTQLFKDTCSKKLVYQVDMIQRDTTHWQFPGVMSMFCEVENIPADYQIEIKYKYVPK